MNISTELYRLHGVGVSSPIHSNLCWIIPECMKFVCLEIEHLGATITCDTGCSLSLDSTTPTFLSLVPSVGFGFMAKFLGWESRALVSEHTKLAPKSSQDPFQNLQCFICMQSQLCQAMPMGEKKQELTDYWVIGLGKKTYENWNCALAKLHEPLTLGNDILNNTCNKSSKSRAAIHFNLDMFCPKRWMVSHPKAVTWQ